MLSATVPITSHCFDRTINMIQANDLKACISSSPIGDCPHHPPIVLTGQ